MEEGFKVIPSTVRIENLDLLELLRDLSEIVKSDPDLQEVRAVNVTIRVPKGAISMGFVAPGVFNLSCPHPETLNMLLQAMKRFYSSPESS